MPQKNNDELISSFLLHSVVVAEQPVELREMTVYKVGGVWDPQLDIVVPWKSRVCLTPEGKVALTPENLFVLTPVKS